MHKVRFGIGRLKCLDCNWEFSIPFNLSMAPEKVWEAYQIHMRDTGRGIPVVPEKRLDRL